MLSGFLKERTGQPLDFRLDVLDGEIFVGHALGKSKRRGCNPLYHHNTIPLEKKILSLLLLMVDRPQKDSKNLSSRSEAEKSFQAQG